MSANSSNPPESGPLVRKLVEAIESDRLDEADGLYAQLCEVNPAAQDALVFPTVIAIRRGQTLDALHRLNSFPEGRYHELKALCLYALGDPTWNRYAEEKVEDSDPFVRQAMQQLLGRTENQHASS